MPSTATEFAIYPNPIHANSILFAILPATGMVQYTILDAYGRIELNGVREVQSGFVEINLSGTKPGTYLIRFTIEEKIFYQKLLIVP
jgi:hypothetical protein